jgi:hypothetical protein
MRKTHGWKTSGTRPAQLGFRTEGDFIHLALSELKLIDIFKLISCKICCEIK